VLSIQQGDMNVISGVTSTIVEVIPVGEGMIDFRLSN
jgi:hypothetical protein